MDETELAQHDGMNQELKKPLWAATDKLRSSIAVAVYKRMVDVFVPLTT